jgi:hypothetical protein
MRLHRVMTAEKELSCTVPSESGLLHETVVLQRLISPWAGSNQIVCGNRTLPAWKLQRTSDLSVFILLVFQNSDAPVPDEILAASRARGARGLCDSSARVQKVFRGS